MRKRTKSSGNFKLRSEFEHRQIARGTSTLHKVTVISIADFDSHVWLLSQCRDDAVAYANHGPEWESSSAKLEAYGWRLRPENRFEFAEELLASGSARSGQMTQMCIDGLRRPRAPTGKIEKLVVGMLHVLRVK